ncbi:MAG: STAS domain-containing protein [Bacteroidia bacterium]|jgi:anti-sigma B factor antagonist|nr:STAS domain-containing protein [Bacteroidia bacterium]
MEIKEVQHERFISLIPVGDLDANSSVYLDDHISRLVASQQVQIHVDFTDVHYISSAGLGVFASHLEELSQHGGQFVLSGMADNIREVFLLLGLDRLDRLTIVANNQQVQEYF